MFKIIQILLLLVVVFNSQLLAQNAADPQFDQVEAIEETNQDQIDPIDQEVNAKASITKNVTKIKTIK